MEQNETGSAALVAAPLGPSREANPSAPAVDPKLRSWVIAVVTTFWLGLSILLACEYALLAIFGGGLSATPNGLRFWFGRRSMHLPWSDIESVGVEQRLTTKRQPVLVLATRFLDGDDRWPRASSLWFSKPHCLCISTYILTDLVAGGLAIGFWRGGDAFYEAFGKVFYPEE